jgi:hypothetical protein
MLELLERDTIAGREVRGKRAGLDGLTGWLPNCSVLSIKGA